MNYLIFQKAFKDFPVFSVSDIYKKFPDFDSRRLVEWQQKNYLQKIRRGFYCFEDVRRGEYLVFFSANKIWKPSYISLEKALSYYNFIPEQVFTVTSVTTRNTATYSTPIGNFDYKNIKPNLFFGYKLVRMKGITFKIAEPEKLFLDLLYYKKINSIDEMEAMRFNVALIREMIDVYKLREYQGIIGSRVLDKRIDIFKKLIYA